MHVVQLDRTRGRYKAEPAASKERGALQPILVSGNGLPAGKVRARHAVASAGFTPLFRNAALHSPLGSAFTGVECNPPSQTGSVGRPRAAMGEPEEALRLATRSSRLVELNLGPGLRGVGKNLASMVAKQGDLDGAEMLFRRGLALHEQAGGLDHPDVAYALAGLAVVTLDNGDPKAAIGPAERALQIREAHPVAAYLLAITRHVNALVRWNTAMRPGVCGRA